MEEATKEATFEVNEVTEVQDLTAVPDTDESLFPVRSGVKVNIKRATVNLSKDGMIKALSLGLQCTEGIPMTDPETGEEVLRYMNAYVNHGWLDFVFWIDPNRPDPKGSGWGKTKEGKHLIGFKQLMKALDRSMIGILVDDGFLAELVGTEVILDTRHETDKFTGQKSLKVKNIKSAE